MLFLKQLFTWWNGQTLNTRFYTWRKGEYVGTDQFGNKYYRAKSALPEFDQGAPLGVYNGYSEASTIPPGWHGWMHHRTDVPPSKEDYAAARLAEALCAEPDRHAQCLPAQGLDPVGRRRRRRARRIIPPGGPSKAGHISAGVCALSRPATARGGAA